MKREVSIMGKALERSGETFCINLRRGKRLRTRISVIENLIDKVDCLLIGGG